MLKCSTTRGIRARRRSINWIKEEDASAGRNSEVKRAETHWGKNG